VLAGLSAGLALSVAGLVVGGQTGTLLIACAGNLLTVLAVYVATERRNHRNGENGAES
jgi:ABC-type Fe3+-siderophore transport system permease subunit